MVDPIGEIMKILGETLKPYATIPNSTFFIVMVACILSIVSTSINRLFVDVKKMKSVMKEVNAWRKQYESAKKSGDKKVLSKAMKKQQAMMKLQSSMMWDRMKVSFIFLAPFWIIFMILSRFYGSSPVALAPFTIPFLLQGEADPIYGGVPLLYFSWYIICSFAISLPISRILGINPED